MQKRKRERERSREASEGPSRDASQEPVPKSKGRTSKKAKTVMGQKPTLPLMAAEAPPARGAQELQSSTVEQQLQRTICRKAQSRARLLAQQEVVHFSVLDLWVWEVLCQCICILLLHSHGINEHF